MSREQDGFAKLFAFQYAVQNVYEAIRGAKPPELGAWGVEHIRGCLESIVNKLTDSGLDLDAIDSDDHEWYLIHYALRRLHARMDRSQALDDESALIFCDFVESKLRHLLEMARELDAAGE